MLKWFQLLVRTYTAGSWVGCTTPFCSDIWPDAKKASLVSHERVLAALCLGFYQGTRKQVESPTFPDSMLPSWPRLDHVGVSHASSLFVFNLWIDVGSHHALLPWRRLQPWYFFPTLILTCCGGYVVVSLATSGNSLKPQASGHTCEERWVNWIVCGG